VSVREKERERERNREREIAASVPNDDASGERGTRLERDRARSTKSAPLSLPTSGEEGATEPPVVQRSREKPVVTRSMHAPPSWAQRRRNRSQMCRQARCAAPQRARAHRSRRRRGGVRWRRGAPGPRCAWQLRGATPLSSSEPKPSNYEPTLQLFQPTFANRLAVTASRSRFLYIVLCALLAKQTPPQGDAQPNPNSSEERKYSRNGTC
jgi:hypothetical protein